ncbi:MAG: hypothetical protein FWG68_10930 [Defluviitaleaceae bacterium]|nr:hypothetical protein [Defluviitaleaceae bacterium]
MKYISTRDETAQTLAMQAAAKISCEDGELFVPETMPRKFDNQDLLCLAWLSHSRRFAYIMGKFMKDIYIGLPALFGDATFGKQTPQIKIVAETKQNPPKITATMENALHFAHLPMPMVYKYAITALHNGGEQLLGYNIAPNEVDEKLAEKLNLQRVPKDGQNWFAAVSYITYFMSVYCEILIKECIKLSDWINVEIPHDETLCAATAAFYAKKMGLPVSKIVCNVPQNSVLYQLVNHGEISADCFTEKLGLFSPLALERLLYGLFDYNEHGTDTENINNAEKSGFINGIICQLKTGEKYILPQNLVDKLGAIFVCVCEEETQQTAAQLENLPLFQLV